MSSLPFDAGTFDIVSSDSLFEHCRDLGVVLGEMFRVLRPGGCVYATFGPIYTSYGGDHFSGTHDLRDAYNHLLLAPEEYRVFVRNGRIHTDDPQEDGRTWIDNGLFSYLRYDDYIKLFTEQAGILFLQLILNPEAYKFKRTYPQKWRALLDLGLYERDLIVLGMTVILSGQRRGRQVQFGTAAGSMRAKHILEA